MHIWIDADACPRPVKEVLYRVAQKRRTMVMLVANQALVVPRSPYIRVLVVQRGFDVADQEIVKRVLVGDLVITADIPLAALVIERGAHAIDPRGDAYTPENIRERLSMRNFMADLRSTGVETGGARAFSARDTQMFANALDRWLAGRIAGQG
jgi:uncharacterized protein